MPQPPNQPGDPERGNVRVDDHLDIQLAHDEPSQGESNFGDGSWPLFSMYSKAKEEEDSKTAEISQRDADGVLIFSGLFSASVAAFLSVTVQDLRPNSQDTSAFYLGNIFEVLTDPNVTRAPTPSFSKPPPFSPPRYAVWVNSLWFLSFALSLICALSAMVGQQWARDYIRKTQFKRRSPEKRARTRAYFASGVGDVMVPHVLIGILRALLHLSLFLFFVGLGIFLFNINHAVFGSAIWSFLLFSYYYVAVLVMRLSDPSLVPFMKTVEQKVSEKSWELDADILDWSIRRQDDDALEKVFEAIPGFLNSKLVNHSNEYFPEDFFNNFWNALNGFMCRNLFNTTESAKSYRLKICMKAISAITRANASSASTCDIHLEGWDQVPPIAEMVPGRLLTYCANDHEHVAHYAQCIVAKILASVPERDVRWIQFATGAFGLSERDLRDHDDDSVSFAIFIHLLRQSIRHHLYDSDALMAFSKLDIRNTRPGLQHDFCTVWNELVQEARNSKSYPAPAWVLERIPHLYIALHRGTDAASTAFSASTDTLLNIMSHPWSYPPCDIASHYPESTAHIPIPDSRAIRLPTEPGDSPDASPYPPSRGCTTFPQQAGEANIIVGSPSPSHLMTISETGGTSHAPITTPFTNPIYSRPRPTDSFPPGGMAAVLQDITSATTLSHSMGNSAQQDVAAEWAAPDIGQNSSSVPKLIPEWAFLSAPAPIPDTPILNKSSTSCGAGSASASNPMVPTSSLVGFFDPAPPPSRVLTFPNEENSPLSSTVSSRPADNATLPRLHARGLVNTGSMCLANAALQLLLHSPPFWIMLKELTDLKGRRGGGDPEAAGGTTPLLDATARFFEEFISKQERAQTQQPPQQAAGGKTREDEKEKKEKRKLKTLLDDKHGDAEEFLGLYLDALDEELVELHTHKPASTQIVEEGAQSGEVQVGRRNYGASSVYSPTSRIFGGRYRSTIRAPSQPDTVTTEAWRSIQLDIQPDSVHTVEDALARVSQPQPVQVGPSSSSEGRQQVLLEAVPQVLVLHLKRFLYDVAADGIVKIRKAIQFASELEIPLEIMAPVAGKSAEPVYYKLYGVLYHHGESAGSGHYSVDVLHPNRDSGSGEGWLHIDDESVKAVWHEDVFGGHDNERRGDERCVYMLFYCRTAPTQA